VKGLPMPARRIAVFLFLVSFAASGQAPVGDGTALALHDATPIRLRLTRDLSFTNVKPGDPVYFEVQDDLRIDGLLVMAHGSRATGTITEAEPKTRMGRGGKLGVSLDSIPLLNGGKAAIRAAKQGGAGGHGDAKVKATEVVATPAPEPLLFAYGKDEAFPEGTSITVYIDGENKIAAGGFLVDMTFSSNPSGALVSMYGTPIGHTPFTTRLAPGTYKAVFSTDGYRDLTRSVPVGPGYSNAVDAAFGK
jgi:hypothetical protein